MNALLCLLLLISVCAYSKSSPHHPNRRKNLFDLLKIAKAYTSRTTQNLVSLGPYINSDNEDETDVNAPIMELAYYGTWQSASSTDQNQFNGFTHNSGYSLFGADDEASDGMNDFIYFSFFDGPYVDQKAAQVNFQYVNDTDFNVGNSTFNNSKISYYLTYYNDLKEELKQNCTGAYQLSFVDSSTNLPYNVANGSYTDAVAYFWINSTDCPVNIAAIVSADDSGRESKALYYAIMVTLICLIHLYATVHMIKNISLNENEGIRYSLMSLSFFAIWDVFMCLFHLYDALTTQDYFHYFIIPAFWYFILSSIFETRLILIVWKTRYYHTFTTPNEVRRGIAIFYVKFYGAMLLLLFLGYTFLPATWFIGLTSVFFIPQIVHSAIRGQKHKFDPVYAFMLGYARIILPLYVRGCPDSIFKLTPSAGFSIFYAAFILFQIFFMYLQGKIGSRFFVPKCFLPPKYNYYFRLSTDMETEEQEACSICMENLNEVPVSSGAPLLTRKPRDVTIMITPCRHKFHPGCLQQWMEIKLECPFCRAPIPSLE